jgi:deoxyribodipyrimidine photolyase-like uncharacterized protein
MYWAYLERHQKLLSNNFRLQMPYNSLAKRAPEKKLADKALFEKVLTLLSDGNTLTPELLTL